MTHATNPLREFPREFPNPGLRRHVATVTVF
jgi:hypothetical protein